MTTQGGSSVFVGRGAVVLSGYPAWLLWRFLRERPPRVEHSRERQGEWALALDHLEAAAHAWLASVEASAAGSAEVPMEPGPSPWEDELTTAEVAQIMDRSTRQVRNLAQALGARKTAGGWVFSRSAVLAYLEARAA